MYIKFQKNLKLAIGGEWTMPAGKAETAAFLKGHRKSRIIDRAVMGERVIGAFPGKEPGTHAGAWLVALLVPNAIVVHELDEGQFWVAAIRDGIPLADHDRVCDWGDASRIMTDVLAFNPSATLIGSTPSASRSLESVLAEADKKALTAARIVMPGATLRLAGAAALGLCVAGLLGWAGWVYMVKRAAEQAPKESALAALAVEANKRRAAEEYRTAAIAAMKEQADGFVRGVRATDAVEFVRAALASEGLAYRGWKLRSVECDIAAGSCRKTWFKGASGNAFLADIESIKKRAGLEEPVGVDLLNAQDFVYVQSRPAPEKALLPVAGVAGALDASALRDVYLRHGLQIQMPSQPAPVAASLPAAPEGAQPVAANLGSQLDFSASGAFAALIAVAPRFDAIGVKSETLKVDNIDTLSPVVSFTGKLIIEVANGNF